MTGLPLDEQVNVEQFSQKWGQFLTVLEGVSRRKLRRHRNENFRQHLLPLLNRVFRSLRSDENIVLLQEAVAAELEDQSVVEALGFLQDELDFYNAWQGASAEQFNDVSTGQYYETSTGQYYDLEDHSRLEEQDDDTDEAISAGKTIKDSAEKLIKKLPRPFQYGLKILNEILSLVGGRA
ncbi:MAG: hypothetical protein AABM67_16835 [Acidobacteriota bacterium]